MIKESWTVIIFYTIVSILIFLSVLTIERNKLCNGSSSSSCSTQ